MPTTLHLRRLRAASFLAIASGALGLLSVPTAASAAPEPALRAGEEATYSVRWAVLPGAGQIRIAATGRESETGTQLSITTTTETRGLAKGLMPFRASSESVFDAEGRIVSLRESSVARSKRSDHSLTFDHGKRQALFTQDDVPEPRALELPEGGNPADLITTLMKTRSWDLPVGDAQDVLVLFGDEFYLLTVHAVRTEKVRTPLGEFETLVLEPRMEKTAPKGMFKRGANVRIWVTRDSRPPVKFQIEFKVGTGVATLVKYTPPTAPLAPTGDLSAEKAVLGD